MHYNTLRHLFPQRCISIRAGGILPLHLFSFSPIVRKARKLISLLSIPSIRQSIINAHLNAGFPYAQSTTLSRIYTHTCSHAFGLFLRVPCSRSRREQSSSRQVLAPGRQLLATRDQARCWASRQSFKNPSLDSSQSFPLQVLAFLLHLDHISLDSLIRQHGRHRRWNRPDHIRSHPVVESLPAFLLQYQFESIHNPRVFRLKDHPICASYSLGRGDCLAVV